MTHPILYFSDVLCLFWGQSLPVAWEFWSSWFWLGSNPVHHSVLTDMWGKQRNTHRDGQWKTTAVCVYVHVYVSATMCVHAEPRVGHRESLSITLCCAALDRVSQWTGSSPFWLGRQTGQRALMILLFLSSDAEAGCLWLELRSSCLHRKYSYLLNTISPRPTIKYLNQ